MFIDVYDSFDGFSMVLYRIVLPQRARAQFVKTKDEVDQGKAQCMKVHMFTLNLCTLSSHAFTILEGERVTGMEEVEYMGSFASIYMYIHMCLYK